MKFANITLALAALAATTGVASAAAIRRTGASGNVIAFADSCSVLSCLESLASLVASCAAAAAEDGLNPIADAKCFADAVEDISDIPADCGGCF